MKVMIFVLFYAAVCSLLMGQAPQWYTTHSHKGYPASDYIIGVGAAGGASGAEAAKKSALADIVSQLRVQVQSEMRSVTQSFAVNDDEQIYSDFKRQSRTMVNDEITGAEVVETVPDGGTTYALVVLNRDTYSAGLRSELESGWRQASDLRTAAAGYFSKGKLTEAIQSVNQIKQVIAPLFAKQVLHNAASRSPFAFPSVFNPAALQNDIRGFLAQVKVEKKGGDGQRGKIGEKLALPLTVALSANGVPLSGVSIVFLLDGKTPVGEAMTDELGIASFSTIVRSGSGITALLSVPGIGREFEENLRSTAAVFQWSAQASDKAFAVTVNAKGKKTAEIIQTKLTTAVSQIGYKIVTMSPYQLAAEVTSGVPGTIEGMAGTLFTVSLEAVVTMKDTRTNAVVGTASFSAKGVGKNENEAMEKAAAGLKIDQAVLSELLQK